MAELRCEFKKHGELVEPGVIEFLCRSKLHNKGPGILVIHRFDTLTGELLETRFFREVEQAWQSVPTSSHSD